jgi:hypothetical protein
VLTLAYRVPMTWQEVADAFASVGLLVMRWTAPHEDAPDYIREALDDGRDVLLFARTATPERGPLHVGGAVLVLPGPSEAAPTLAP